MVYTEIKNAKIEITSNAPSKDEIFAIVETILKESADEICVTNTVLKDYPGEPRYYFSVQFDVYDDGLFVGNTVAEEIEATLAQFECTNEHELNVLYITTDPSEN